MQGDHVKIQVELLAPSTVQLHGLSVAGEPSVIHLAPSTHCTRCRRRYKAGDVVTGDFTSRTTYHTDCDDPRLEQDVP